MLFRLPSWLVYAFEAKIPSHGVRLLVNKPYSIENFATPNRWLDTTALFSFLPALSMKSSDVVVS